MAKETFQLQGNAAAVYEEQKVPAMFGPLAEATLDRVPIKRGDRILDVACGTGIVARKIKQRLGDAIQVVGADLNEGMIEIARALQDPVAKACEWHIAGVADMPFVDGEFSLVACQQGFQFFPDDSAALREMKRVLAPGGRIALTIWSGPSPFFIALSKSIAKHVGAAAAKQSLAPFSYDGHATILARMSEAGFSDPSKEELTVDRNIGDPDTAIEKEILANTVGPAVKAKGAAVMRSIVAEVADATQEFRRNSNLIIPQQTYLYQGHVP